MDRKTFAVSDEVLAERKRVKKLYMGAVRDWVLRGSASRHALDENRATAKLKLPSATIAEAHARFRLGLHLLNQGQTDEAQAQLALERERLSAEREAARVRVDASRTQLAAAERRALLARESRGFFDKSFRLGETDLPTRLRIEAEAAEAERQAARTRLELAAAISAWRQALGLLPQ